jgi:hypothetical protein
MEATIISSKELRLNCWSPKRFLKLCYQCRMYHTCKYPERIVDDTYEKLKADFNKAYVALRDYKKSRRIK